MIASILTTPGGWIFLLLVAFWIALAWFGLVRRAWPFYFTPPARVIRIDDELARRDREARTYAEVNSIRLLSTPAPKGFSKRSLPPNSNHLRAVEAPSKGPDHASR